MLARRFPWLLVLRWALGVGVVALIVGVPSLYFRAVYEHSRRFKLVTDSEVTLPDGTKVHHTVYRSGQLTANGFREAIQRYGIKTVVNLQQENTDPLLPASLFRKPSVREQALVESLGARYIQLDGGVLDNPGGDPKIRPKVIDEFLEVMRDPKNHPVLFHCKAGLHRTGLMTGMYRMEFQGATHLEALEELKANGFGHFSATEQDEYVNRFLLQFQPTPRTGQAQATAPAGGTP